MIEVKKGEDVSAVEGEERRDVQVLKEQLKKEYIRLLKLS